MNLSSDRRRSDRRGREKTIYGIHLARVRTAKGLIDCAPPRPHPFTNKMDLDQVVINIHFLPKHNQWKTEFLTSIMFIFQRRKLAAIQSDNKILLDRLATIVQSKVDDKQDPLMVVHASFKIDMLKTKKRLETERINSENQRLLNRIRLAPPAYSNVEWQEHARISERHKRSMALYPEFYDKSEKERSGKEQRQSVEVECDSATKKTNAPGSGGSDTIDSSPAMSDSCYSSLTTTPCPSTCSQAQYQWPGNLLTRGCPVLKRNGNIQLPAL